MESNIATNVPKIAKYFVPKLIPVINKGLKNALYFLRQSLPHAGSTRSKVKILENEVDFGAGRGVALSLLLPENHRIRVNFDGIKFIKK